MRIVLVATVVSSALGLSGCGHAPPPAPVDDTPPAAAVIVGAPVVAIRAIDAPGFNVADLTARLRDGFARTSGAPVVDDVSVRAEIAACVEMPCKDDEQRRFAEATIVVGSSLSKVGPAIIGSIHVQKGMKELYRGNAQGSDAGAVAHKLGLEGGAALNAVLRTSTETAVEAPEASER